MMSRFKKSKSHRSLFSHLVVVLIIITVLVNVTVFSVFRHFGMPGKFQWRSHLERYVAYITSELGDPPSKEKAVKIAKELKIEVSFSGNNTHWKTSEKMPDFEDFTGSGVGHYSGGLYKIKLVPSGKVIFWIEGSDWVTRSTRQISGLIIFFSLVFLLAGWFLRHLLRPLKDMEKSFAEVSKGNFETRMEIFSPREFHSTAEGFNSMVKKISEMIQNRDTLLRDISHELRSPLARIKLAVSMMSESDEKESVEEDIIEMEYLVTDILDAYRFTQNNEVKSELNLEKSKEKLNISELVSGQIERFQKIFYQARFKKIFHQENIFINGNRKKLKRLIGNLLENAVKHNQPEGDIQIELNLIPGEEMVEICISDKGVGIQEEYWNKIFEPFYRVEEGRTRGSGYGLGLFLCREIVHSHGGTIRVLKNEPQGVIFEVRLPVL